METENIVRLLTIGSLAGLLMAVGMRLTVKQVVNALRKRRLALIVAVNSPSGEKARIGGDPAVGRTLRRSTLASTAS
jgi:hypothetical protein